MATLYFEVQADYDKVIRLRDEVTRLEKALDAMQGNGSREALDTLSSQLDAARKELQGAVTAAAKAGTELDTAFSGAARAAGELGGSVDRVTELSYALYENERALGEGMQRLQQWKADAEAAFDAGDTGTLEAITADIRAQVADVQALADRNAELRAQIEAAASAGTQYDASLDGVRRAIAEVGDACGEQERALSLLVSEYDTLARQLDRMESADTREAKAIRERMQVIQGEVAVRRGLLGELRQNSNALEANAQAMEREAAESQVVETRHESLRSQIRMLREQMADMAANGIDQQSEAYQRLAAELGRLTDIQGDVATQGRVLANDERNYAGIASGLQGIAGAATAAQGAIALFGGAEEDLQPILQKTYALMAITNAIQQVSQALNKDSAFRLVTLAKAREWWNKVLAVGRGEQVADTAATTANTGAQAANAAAMRLRQGATTGATAATNADTAAEGGNAVGAGVATAANLTLAGAFRAVGFAIKSIPVFGWIAAGVGALVAVVSHFVGKAREARKAAEEMYKAMAEGAYKPVGALKQLQSGWNALGDDLEAKKKYIEDNKDRFDELGVSVKDVSDAENLLVRNADAFIQAQILKAKATITLNKAMKGVEEMLETEAKLEDASDYGTLFGVNVTYTGKRTKLQKQLEEQNAAIEEAYEQVRQYEEEAARVLRDAGITAPDDGKASAATEKAIRKESDRTEAVRAKVNAEEVRAMKDRELARRQAEIDMMEEGTAKTIKQIQLNYEKEREAVEREALDLRQARIDAERKVWEANPANKGMEFDEGTVDTTFTEEQLAYFNTLYERIEAERSAALAELAKRESDAMNDFLKQYGTYEERRLAITREYEGKIAKAQTVGERASLTRQMDADVAALAKDFGDTANWEAIFTNLDNYSVEFLRGVQARLKDMLYSEDLTADQAAAIGKQLDQVSHTIEQKSTTWLDVLGLISERRRNLASLAEDEARAQDVLNASVERQNALLEESEDIRKQLADMLGGAIGTDVDASALTAQSATDMLSQAEANGADEDTVRAIKDLVSRLLANDAAVAENERTVNANTQALENASEAYKGAKEQESSPAEQTKRALDFAQKVATGLSELGDLSDVLGMPEGMGDTFRGLSDGVNSSINAFKDFTSGNYVGAVVDAFSAIGSFGTALGLWGDSDKSLAADIERMTAENESLQKAIEGLTKEMSANTTSMADATEDYRTMIDNLQAAMDNTSEMMQRSAANYASGIGGSHSSNYYIDRNIDASEWATISRIVGRSITSANDFWTLTSEEMYDVSTQAASIYAKIKEYADKGYRDASVYMDEYITYWQELDELTDAYNQKLTSTSFDSVADSFKSALMDMNHSAADWADDFEDMMKEAVINGMLADTYNSRLEKWYKDFADKMESDGTLTSQEQEELRNDYMRIVNDATEELEGLYETLGWSKTGYSQAGTQGGFTTMSEDTAQELNGRFTALQEAAYQLTAQADMGGAYLGAMAGRMDLAGDDIASMADISRDTLAMLANSYLELQQINDNTLNSYRQLQVASGYLKTIRENTDRL